MKTSFIIEHENTVYVPRPTSVGAGMSRDVWIRGCLKKEVRIASPDSWAWLSSHCEVKEIAETADGFEVREVRK